MYRQDPGHPDPELLAALVLLDYAASFFTGFALPIWTGRKGFAAVVSGIVLLQIAVVFATWDRFINVVTYSEHPEVFRPIWTSPLGAVLAVSLVAGSAALALYWRWVRARLRSLPSGGRFD
jgi:hypothetical protein